MTSALTKNERLLELAARVEGGEGADRELDDAIATALFTEKHRTCIKGLSDEAGGMWMFRYPDGSIGSALRFSGSLDAAMTLVPEGWSVALRWSVANEAMANVYDPSDTFWGEPEKAIGTTPALALVAASLRAIAATTNNQDDT